MNWSDENLNIIAKLRTEGYTWNDIAKHFGTTIDSVKQVYGRNKERLDDSLLDHELVVHKHLQTTRAQTVTRDLRQQLKAVSHYVVEREDVLIAVDLAIKNINKRKPKTIKLGTSKTTKKMTIELLLSDWQIGKKMDAYSVEIARKRLQEYTRASIYKMKEHRRNGYKIERLVLAMLGDIIESAEKHRDSQKSTECSTPQQIQYAIEYLYVDLIEPLAGLGIPIDVIGIAGNHDHDLPKMCYYRAGQNHFTWVIYNTLKLLCETQKLTHIKFDIPEGFYGFTEIYGRQIVYEHGYQIDATYTPMTNQLMKRSHQLKKYVTYFRMGDKHNIRRFDNDRLVVNGSFFGADSHASEYSGAKGHCAPAEQIMFCYVPRTDDRLPLYDSFVIQLQHIT